MNNYKLYLLVNEREEYPFHGASGYGHVPIDVRVSDQHCMIDVVTITRPLLWIFQWRG